MLPPNTSVLNQLFCCIQWGWTKPALWAADLLSCVAPLANFRNHPVPRVMSDAETRDRKLSSGAYLWSPSSPPSSCSPSTSTLFLLPLFLCRTHQLQCTAISVFSPLLCALCLAHGTVISLSHCEHASPLLTSSSSLDLFFLLPLPFVPPTLLPPVLW